MISRQISHEIYLHLLAILPMSGREHLFSVKNKQTKNHIALQVSCLNLSSLLKAFELAYSSSRPLSAGMALIRWRPSWSTSLNVFPSGHNTLRHFSRLELL